VLHEESESAMTASTFHKAIDRATLDEPAPEAARSDVPSDL